MAVGWLMKPGVTEIDRGWKRIQRTVLAKGGVGAARVGVQGAEAKEKHSPPYMTNVCIFTVHEFGRPELNIPERPVFRSIFDEKRKKYERELKAIGQRMVSGKESAAAGLRMLGEEYRGDMITKVKRGQIKPRLKASTVDARTEKGGTPAKRRAKKRGKTENVPLWDTGQMMGSIRVVLEK